MENMTQEMILTEFGLWHVLSAPVLSFFEVYWLSSVMLAIITERERGMLN